jgi:MFS family permease
VRYRWAVLAAGGVASASTGVFVLGLPVLLPTLRAEYTLSLGEIGVVLAAQWIGTTVALIPWGLAADRFGERIVMSLGLAGCAVFLVASAFAPGFPALVGLLALAGASGAAVNSASGRAVMQWFDASERGLALGIRQSAIPVGGFLGAVVLPALADAGGSTAGLLFIAGVAAVASVVGALVLRGREGESELEAASIVSTLGDVTLWRLSVGSALYLYAQFAILGFAVLFLHDEHGLSASRAALVIALAQVLAIAFRVGAGRWSDVVGSRTGPLVRIGVAITLALLLVGALADGPLWLLVPALVLGGGLSMAWNGLSFTAAAELAGLVRSGAAIGLQQTVLGAAGIVSPLAFAAVLSATSWQAAFALAAAAPLTGAIGLRTLRGTRLR